MLRRHMPLLVKENIPSPMEFGFSRMTDRRPKFASIHQGAISDTIHRDVTNLSYDLQDREPSVNGDPNLSNQSTNEDRPTNSCNESPMSSQNDFKELGESSATYVESLKSGPLHELTGSISRPRLTLSAFRRPEESVRVADPDASRNITDSYKLGAGIGHGAMSTVRIAERKCDGLKVAVKTVSKHDVLRTRRFGRRRRHMDEWEVLRLLKDNPNVVRLIDVFESEDEVQMVLEYCKGGELFHHIQRNHSKCTPYTQSEAQAAKIVEQILSVLSDLHGRGIVHRDVKPENILLTNNGGNEVKICDFGLARLLLEDCDSESCSSDDEGVSPGRRRAYSRVGSDLYAAPEVCMRDGYGTAIDVYSLGVTLYVFLYGYPPIFDIKDDGELTVAFDDTQWSQVSDECKELIRQMLESDPEHRITAAGALDSPWIKQHVGSHHSSLTNDGSITSHRRSSSNILRVPRNSSSTVDLELVKTILYNNITSDRKRVKPSVTGSHKKRRMHMRVDRLDQNSLESDVLLSMADLYRGVASAAVSATNAAKGVVCDERSNTVNVLVEGSHYESSDDSVDSILTFTV